MDFKGSKTEQNLILAFSGESQARNKYTFFAEIAKEEGYEQIASIFEETANNEKAHAKIWFKALGGLSNTKENLKAGITGEHYEWTHMYPDFAKVAQEEGFNDIAHLFEMVAKIESEHEKRYQKLLDNLENGEVFKRKEPEKWECMNCGYVHYGKEALKVCPVCGYKQGYFEIKDENY